LLLLLDLQQQVQPWQHLLLPEAGQTSKHTACHRLLLLLLQTWLACSPLAAAAAVG
jgi:hypothetical protein